jgi:phage terminase large subunit-like protein
MFPNAKHDEHIDLTAYAIEKHLMGNKGKYNIN